MVPLVPPFVSATGPQYVPHYLLQGDVVNPPVKLLALSVVTFLGIHVNWQHCLTTVLSSQTGKICMFYTKKQWHMA